MQPQGNPITPPVSRWLPGSIALASLKTHLSREAAARGGGRGGSRHFVYQIFARGTSSQVLRHFEAISSTSDTPGPHAGGNMTLWLKSCGLYDRKSTESSNLAVLPRDHTAPVLCLHHSYL